MRETDGLGNNTIPAGYNKPNMGLGTAVQAGPNPEAELIADSAEITPNGIDNVNRGFSVGGADDPLAEAEYTLSAKGIPGMNIGKGTPTAPYNRPSHPPMASTSFGENEIDENDINENDLNESDIFENDINENDINEDELVVESFESLPEFYEEEDVVTEDIAALPVDEDGIINPVVIPEDTVVEPELGSIPEVVLPNEEQVVMLDADDDDVILPEDIMVTEGEPVPIVVENSFKLPENQRVIVSKNDQIFYLGKVRKGITPRFAESAFIRALKALCDSSNRSSRATMEIIAESSKHKQERVAVVGRSLLVEVAKDWRLPGTTTVFEKNDLLQIVSSVPMREADEEVDEDEKKENDKKENDKAESDIAKEKEERLKKEALFALRRWKETKKKKDEDDVKEDEKKENDKIDELEKELSDSEKAKENEDKKEKEKKESSFLGVQKARGWL